MEFPRSTPLRVAAAIFGIVAGVVTSHLPGVAACPPSGGEPGAFGCGRSGSPAAIPSASPVTGAGNPIDLATGNKHQRELDLGGTDAFSLPPLVRSYNSRLAGRVGAFGPGWMHGYEAAVWRRNASEWQLLQADGRRLRFRRAPGPGAVGFAADDPADGRLEPSGDTLTWVWGDGRRLRFAASSGRLETIEGADGRRLLLRYGPGSRLLSVLAPDGAGLHFAYDADARVAMVERNGPGRGSKRRLQYDYDALGNLVAVRDGAAQRRRYRYDDALHPHHLTAIEQQRVPFRAIPVGMWGYDAQGRATGFADGHGGTLTVAYGVPAEPGSGATTTVSNTVSNTVTNTVTDIVTDIVTNTVRSRVMSVAATATTTATSAANTTDTGASTATGEGWVRVRDGFGRGGAYRFARYGDVLRLVEARGAACQSCPVAPARYRYDAAGRLRAAQVGGARLRIERDAGGGQRAIDIGSARYIVDGRGHLQGWSAPGFGGVRLQRDVRGAVVSGVDASGHAVRLVHDASGRLVERVAIAPGRASELTRWRFRGDALVAIEHPHAPLAIERPAGARFQTLVEQRGKVAIRRRFDLNAHGRRYAETLAPGVRLVHRYDRLGQLRGIELELRGARRLQPLVARLRWAGGHLLGMRLGNGVDVAIERNPQGRPWRWRHRVTHCRPPLPDACRSDTLLDYALQLRADGRIGAIWRAEAGDASPQETIYDYDSAGRLIQATESGAGGRRMRYAYDHTGRRRLAQPADACRPGHDAAARQRRCGAREYAYDAAGRLHSVHQAGRLLVTHRYDASGHRVSSRHAPGGYRHLLRDGERVVAELDGDGRLLRRYVYVGRVPVAVIDWRSGAGHAVPTVHFVHSDHLGAPILATDIRARPVWRAAYTPFGRTRIVAATGFTLPLRRPGQIVDSATGLIDNTHRWYDPATGRFLTPDPAGLNGGPDRHAYAAHDPVNFVDPDGRLLVAFDGTWNATDPDSALLAPDGDATNVWLLHQLYAQPDRFDAQGVASVTRFYERGIGTDGGLFDRWLAGATGYTGRMKVERQLGQLARHLADDATAQRTVMLDVVGFSRGAALARDFVNRVLDAQARGRFAASGKCVAVRFLGLFDTVAMFGVAGSADLRFELRVPAEVGYVAHATALNEHHPLLPLESIEGTPARHVEQPLLGGHGDIGGGYLYETAERHPGDLSNVALQWMLGQARGAGIAFEPLPERYASIGRPILHDERQPLGRLDLADDRRIHFPETDAEPILQTDARFRDPVYGQNLERLIDRPPRLDGSNFGGTVRMAEYREWLASNAGLMLP